MCKKVFDKRCSDEKHSWDEFDGHEGHLMPPPAPVRFDDVVERIFQCDHWLQGAQGVGKLCLVEGGEVALSVMGKQVMFKMAQREVAGKQMPELFKKVVEMFNVSTVAQYKDWIERGKNIKMVHTGTVVEAGEGAGQAFMDRSMKQLANVADNSVSINALKANAKMSAAFLAFEIGYLVFQHWGQKRISWTEFRYKSYEALVGQVTSVITSWAGAAAASLLAGAFLGPAGVALAVVFGGIVGGAAGQYVGRLVVYEFLPPSEESQANARSIVTAMDALDIWVDDPIDMTMEQVTEAFRAKALQVHPDKVVQKPGETQKQYEEKQVKATVDMSLLNHHYSLLKAYIENRDTAKLWGHVPVSKHWREKRKQQSLRLKF